MDDVTQLERSLARRMMKTVDEHALIKPGDHLLVAISGGKDSYALVHLLHRAQRRAPFPFRITAVHVDQRQPGYDGAPLERWLVENSVPHLVVHEDTYSVVVEKTAPGGTYCAVCSRLRRGILYSTAEKLGCNKIALGHHLDDALETFLMNLFFAGKLQAMPARYRTDDNRFDVVRPLIDVPESMLVDFAKAMAFPILPCNLCGQQEGLQRDEMRALLDRMSESHPMVRQVMAGALKNVRPSHLLDSDVARVWAQAGGELARGRKPGLHVLDSDVTTDGAQKPL